MPRANPNIIVDSRVSARMHYLRRTAFASAVLSVDTNAPGPVSKHCNIRFDALPDIVILLRLTCLRYLGRTPSRRRQMQPQQQPNVEEEVDLLEDAIQPPSTTESDNESDDEVIDHRLAHPDTSYQFVNPSLLGLSGAYATPAQFFLHSLPCAHIQRVVIPAINFMLSNWTQPGLT
ncbi:hypothetical protein [Absidia glauca]|uniref:Uncharacterized protein n=1 Tax=Absidia glauca TaxID=4829 RepID=A0A168N0U2_ABSGL|nr:hypothetical protein [Absidia glauca]